VNSAAEIGGDPSVCYRHPDRTSWTLCERCGRTICPECQILTPQGVRCPTCVQEMGGSVQWSPVGSAAKASAAKAAKAQKERASAQRAARRPRWQQVTLDFLRPGNRIPIATWTIAVVSIALWVVGFFTANLPATFLDATVLHAEWVWTYFTAPFAYPAIANFSVILGFIFNIVFLLLIAPQIERGLSRARFLSVFFAAGAAGAALTVLAGGASYGLTAPLFGLFGSFLVAVWSQTAIRNQILIVLGINLLFTLVLGGNLAGLVGGLAGGVAASLLFRRFDNRQRSAAATPYLLLFGGVAVLIVLAAVRGVLTFGL
jgi:membrane associated rhomboid family serine protease